MGLGDMGLGVGQWGVIFVRSISGVLRRWRGRAGLGAGCNLPLGTVLTFDGSSLSLPRIVIVTVLIRVVAK